MNTKEIFQQAVKKYSRLLLREYVDTPGSVNQLREKLFSSVVGDLLTAPKKVGKDRDRKVPKAEETALELIRLGVPKKSLSFGFMDVCVPLQNAVCILHRLRFPPGTVEISWKGYRRAVTTSLPAKDLARIILELDELLPELEGKTQELAERVAVELMALKIQRITVKRQLEEVLPAMGIRCGFDVIDDKVHLQLTRTFQGEMEIPLSELQAFLSNPDRIFASLQPPSSAYVEDDKDPIHRRFILH